MKRDSLVKHEKLFYFFIYKNGHLIVVTNKGKILKLTKLY